MEELKELKRKIKRFKFESKRGFSRLLLQLFGLLGNGKSSFINTCKYVWDDGEFINHTSATSDHGGHTMNRISYKLTKTVTLVDNRGCATMNSYETGEIYAQLANLLPLDTPVERSKGYELMTRINMAETTVRSSDFIFPIFVDSAKRVLTPDDINILRELFSTARDITGIFPIVVLTYKTHGDVSKKERIFRNLGVEQVFALENYTPTDQIQTRGRNRDVLRFLHDVIKDVEFRMTRRRNPEREMMERKVFILRYIEEREEKQENQNRQQSHPNERIHSNYRSVRSERGGGRPAGVHGAEGENEQQSEYE